MSRKNEIEEAASKDSGYPDIDYYQDPYRERLAYTHYRAFADGAKWADEHSVNGTETSDYYAIRKDRYDLLVKTLKEIAMTDFSYGIQKKIKSTLEYAGEDNE